MMNESYGEKIKKAIKKTDTENMEIKIVFPRDTYKKFSKWCNEQSADCFWLGIEKLLNSHEHKILISEELADMQAQIIELADSVDDVKTKMDLNKIDNPVKRRSFGRKGE